MVVCPQFCRFEKVGVENDPLLRTFELIKREEKATFIKVIHYIMYFSL